MRPYRHPLGLWSSSPSPQSSYKPLFKFEHMRYLNGARKGPLAAWRENWTAWIGLQLRRTVQNNVTTSPVRSCVFGRANEKGSAARQSVRVRNRVNEKAA